MSNDQYAVLAELAGGFIHEIKNHLSTLGLNLQLLAEDFQDPETQREIARSSACSVCNRNAGILSKSPMIFCVCPHQGSSPGPADMDKVLEELIDFFGPTANAAAIDLKTYLPADLPRVRLDKELFKQALLNLLLNAEQAMPQGGSITIQAGVEPPLSGGQPSVYLSIIDTGQGMAAEMLAKIFQPFFSTKPSGSGLGLPTARRHC